MGLALRTTCRACLLSCAGVVAWTSIPTEGVICSAPWGPAAALCFLLRAFFDSVSGPGAMMGANFSHDLRSLSDTQLIIIANHPLPRVMHLTLHGTVGLEESAPSPRPRSA